MERRASAPVSLAYARNPEPRAWLTELSPRLLRIFYNRAARKAAAGEIEGATYGRHYWTGSRSDGVFYSDRGHRGLRILSRFKTAHRRAPGCLGSRGERSDGARAFASRPFAPRRNSARLGGHRIRGHIRPHRARRA